MAISGAQRVAEANRQALSGQTGGALTKSGQIVNASGQVVGGVGTSRSVNPKDLPSYVPGSSPDDRLEGQGPISTLTQDLKKSITPTPQVPDQTATESLSANIQKTQQGINNLAKQQGVTLQQTPTGGYTAVPDSGAMYRQAFEQTNASGVEAPQTPGAGYAGARTVLDSFAQQDNQSILGGVQETDSMFDSLFVQYDDYFSPQKQRTSLLDEYQKLSDSLGISGLNADIINTKRILEGTEDDIRNEITASGGLATDSQVMALSNARNKTLLKNYQTLVDTKNAAMEQLGTMMQLSIQDRQFAEAEFDRKMNYAFKVAEFKQKATDNARSGLQWAIQNGAGAEILNNPYETRLVEKTLGLPAGGLAGIVQQQALETQKAQADIQNIQSQIAERAAKVKNDAKAQQKTQNAVTKADVILTNVNTALEGVGGGTSGFFGGITKNIPGTSAYNLNKTITTIKANIGFAELQAMREASPTGGALGNVANQELEALQATLGSLDIGQTPEQLKTNLNAIKSHYTNWLNTVGYEVAPDGTIIQITD